MVEIKTPEQIAKMRAAGLVVAEIHRRCAAAAVPGASTAELDEIAAATLREMGAKPNFLGYGGFTGNICTSVNEVVVHGIPGPETVLASGDIISIDAGAVVDGWHADAALTVFVGEGHPEEVRELSRVTDASLWAGIAAMRKGAGWSTSPRRSKATSGASRGRHAASTGSSRSTAGTASAPRCTWTRTS